MTIENSVKFIRLNNGEDIIADTFVIPKSENEDAYCIVKQPMKVIYFPNPNKNGLSISLMEWVFTRISETQEFNISNRDILFLSNPSKSLIDFYQNSIDGLSERMEAKTEFTNDVDYEFEDSDQEYDDHTEESLETLQKLVEQLQSVKKTIH